MDNHFFILIALTMAMLALRFTANIILLAGARINTVPLAARLDWRARVNTVMLVLPAFVALAGALLKG